MLDPNSGLSLKDGVESWPSYAADRPDNVRIGVRSIRRSKFLIASCGLFFLALGVIYSVLRPVTYTASSQLLVYNKELQPGPETVITPGRTDASLVQNQIEIIQSRNLLLKVVDDLGLRNDEEFVAKNPSLSQSFRQWLAASSEPPVSSDEYSMDGLRAIEALKRHLTVRRVGTSHTITVSFRTSNPSKAAQIINQIVKAYLGDQAGSWRAGQSSNPWLRERLMSLGANARVISEADPPIRPDGPRLILVVAGATLLGLAFGAAIALLRDILDRTVRTSEQATMLFGVECLGVIPNCPAGRSSTVNDSSGVKMAIWSDIWTRPSSDVLQFRRLRAALLEQPNLRIIGVTSAVSGEGVTTVAANTARFLADTGRKVLLIDGALHDLGMSRGFAPDTRAKMNDAADKINSVEAAIVSKEGSSLHFLPLGNEVGTAWNEHIDNFLRDAAESYDYIVIDLPPLTFGVEVRIAAQTIDTLLLVIKWGSTKAEIVQSALRSSGKAQLKFIGFILNMAKPKRMREHGENLSLNDLVVPSTDRFTTKACSQAAPHTAHGRECKTLKTSPMRNRAARGAPAALAMLLAVGLVDVAAAADYIVRPDDKLKIRIYQIPELSGEYVVGSNGTVSMGPVGEILIAGLSLGNVAAQISEHLIGNGLSQNPGTSVEIVQARPIYVLGDVQRPGEYPFRPGITVIQAISVAGGYFRFSDPGLLRLERDAISNRGELRTLARRLTYLRARRARLSAELEDRSDVVFPPEMIREANSDSAVAQLLDEERSLLTLNRTALQHQLESLNRAHQLYEREIQTITAQIQAEKRQYQAVERELNEIRALSSRGLAPVPRQTGLERTQAQILSTEQGLHTLILRARQNITSVEQKSFDLQSERRTRVNAELQQTRLEIEEVLSKIETTQKLVVEAEITAPGLVRRSTEMMTPRSLGIVRMIDGDAVSMSVEDDHVLQPGDVLKVHPNEPPSATGMAERAAELPTGSVLGPR